MSEYKGAGRGTGIDEAGLSFWSRRKGMDAGQGIRKDMRILTAWLTAAVLRQFRIAMVVPGHASPGTARGYVPRLCRVTQRHLSHNRNSYRSLPVSHYIHACMRAYI